MMKVGGGDGGEYGGCRWFGAKRVSYLHLFPPFLVGVFGVCVREVGVDKETFSKGFCFVLAFACNMWVA